MEKHHRILFYALSPSGHEQIEHWFDGECSGRYRLETGVGVSQGDVEHALLSVDADAILAHRLREIGIDFVKVAACEDVILFPAGEE